MSRDQQVRIDEIVRNNCREILNKYFTKDLAVRISNEISSGVEWDIANMEGEDENR